MIKIQQIETNPDQPRKIFHEESLQELADSIREQGVLQPILVEKKGLKYCIVAGERRYRAASLAGLETIPAIVKSFTQGQKLEVALIENIQRENLNPIEESKAFRYLIETSALSQEELSKRIGKKRSTIANSLRLLNLNDSMQAAISAGNITAGHARALLSVVNPSDQIVLFEKIQLEGLSVRQAEKLASELNEGSRAAKNKKKSTVKKKNHTIIQIEEKFIEALGTKVSVKGTLEKGKLEISYFSADDLERVYELLSRGDDTLLD